MKFLLEGERAWCGASKFYETLHKLGIPVAVYTLPVPSILSAEEMHCYLDSLEHDLKLTKSQANYTEYYQDIKTVLTTLRGWADKGFVIHVKF